MRAAGAVLPYVVPKPAPNPIRVTFELPPDLDTSSALQPMQNGYVESFNGKMRDELLNETLFFSLDRQGSKSCWMKVQWQVTGTASDQPNGGSNINFYDNWTSEDVFEVSGGTQSTYSLYIKRIFRIETVSCSGTITVEVLTGELPP